jgi:hypothetical protein
LQIRCKNIFELQSAVAMPLASLNLVTDSKICTGRYSFPQQENMRRDSFEMCDAPEIYCERHPQLCIS